MDYYSKYCSDRGWKKHKPRNAEYVLLHSLSHMLIKEMAMQSSYSSAAMHERIYSGEGMCGLLIYTGAPDAEGSLGGLVELGSMEKFIPLSALKCSSFPRERAVRMRKSSDGGSQTTWQARLAALKSPPASSRLTSRSPRWEPSA